MSKIRVVQQGISIDGGPFQIPDLNLLQCRPVGRVCFEQKKALKNHAVWRYEIFMDLDRTH